MKIYTAFLRIDTMTRNKHTYTKECCDKIINDSAKTGGLKLFENEKELVYDYSHPVDPVGLITNVRADVIDGVKVLYGEIKDCNEEIRRKLLSKNIACNFSCFAITDSNGRIASCEHPNVSMSPILVSEKIFIPFSTDEKKGVEIE